MLGIRGGSSKHSNEHPINLNFRDEAVDVKNAAELELAKNRIEMMQVSYGDNLFID